MAIIHNECTKTAVCLSTSASISSDLLSIVSIVCSVRCQIRRRHRWIILVNISLDRDYVGVTL